ncbi:hypothetical protein ACA910_013774 [Epithemia clementina (nom. ined.)]
MFLTKISDDGFRLYYSIFLWVTGIIAGMGSEIFVCVLYLQSWCPERELWWRYVQLLFPLLVTTSVGLASQRNFFALIFAVVGLWKFGFPETIMYIYVGFFDTKAPKLRRIGDVLNGLGTIIHHSIVVWFISLQLGGLLKADRYVLSCATVPLMQHWFPLVAYANANLYTAIQLCLEVYFEWICFSYIDHVYNTYGLASAMTAGVMVLAHWMYLAAATIDIFAPQDDDEDDMISVSTNNTPFRNVHTRGVQVFARRHSIKTTDYELNSETMEITTASTTLRGGCRMSSGGLS